MDILSNMKINTHNIHLDILSNMNINDIRLFALTHVVLFNNKSKYGVGLVDLIIVLFNKDNISSIKNVNDMHYI